ncbi:MAG: DUF4062 domain-containing protein [Cytophagaceae bacterium]|nr:DUF4062 domain-containing protein [Cytophagaceae bacterium]
MLDTKYQIFISFPFRGLEEARDKIIKTVLTMYHIPVGMKMFSADNDEQWITIQDTISNSDYYCLIIGHRYGSETKEGIGYTEKEFDFAKEIDLPVYAFIQNRNMPTKPIQQVLKRMNFPE